MPTPKVETSDPPTAPTATFREASFSKSRRLRVSRWIRSLFTCSLLCFFTSTPPQACRPVGVNAIQRNIDCGYAVASAPGSLSPVARRSTRSYLLLTGASGTLAGGGGAAQRTCVPGGVLSNSCLLAIVKTLEKGVSTHRLSRTWQPGNLRLAAGVLNGDHGSHELRRPSA